MMQEVMKIKVLLDYCDDTKVFFRQRNNTIAEELFAYLAFKIGIMLETIIFYTSFAQESDYKILKTYHTKEMPVLNMKLFEIQHLILPQFISIIESKLREWLQQKGYTKKDLLLCDILKCLYKNKLINQEQLHLWSGIRHIRNSSVHYNQYSKVTNTYKFTPKLILILKENKPISSNDLFQDFHLMQWMAKDIKKVLLKIYIH